MGSVERAPSTGSPSFVQGLIRINAVTFSAASENPRPSGSPARGAQSCKRPSLPAARETAPRPDVSPLAAAAAGNNALAWSGLGSVSQTGWMTDRR
jgi:hypothetical protein